MEKANDEIATFPLSNGYFCRIYNLDCSPSENSKRLIKARLSSTDSMRYYEITFEKEGGTIHLLINTDNLQLIISRLKAGEFVELPEILAIFLANRSIWFSLREKRKALISKRKKKAYELIKNTVTSGLPPAMLPLILNLEEIFG
ncbi:MAG: hypothetical protein ACTSV6_05495 [Candidatus Heimdallarchaeota archaeon]